MRTTTWIAVMVGAAAGTVAALASKPTEPQLPAPEIRPVAAAPTATAKREVLVPPAPPSASAPAAASSAPQGSGPVTPVVGSRYELTGYEIACHEKKDPGACRAVATAYEEGKVVEADPAKAKLFRRIELTFLVKHCESQLPLACSDLAYRYQRGDGVARNERTAQALLDRARKLCTGRRSEGCAALR